LETTNEELQSTNEELETMNEEQEATNEELQVISDEMQRRTNELNDPKLFLESVLSSLQSGVAVLNRDLKVQVWNRGAEDPWGLRADEAVGQHFFNLDIGLPLEGLRQGIRACLNEQSDGEQLTLAATNRRGRSINCQVTVSPLRYAGRQMVCAIVFMAELESEPSR
jgi:two-component system CheB/CheR fusion protein